MILPMEPIRLAIIGCSGSGKTTLATRVERARGIPRLELDSVYHQPGWTAIEETEFRKRVGSFITENDQWVVDGNYKAVRDLIWERVTGVVWLHPARGVLMRRLAIRTIRRVLTRQELWNGNREPFSNLYSFEPERSVLAWAWRSYEEREREYARLMGFEGPGRVPIERLRTNRDVKRFLNRLTSSSGG
jgi:adenylate kinase family enzyme